MGGLHQVASFRPGRAHNQGTAMVPFWDLTPARPSHARSSATRGPRRPTAPAPCPPAPPGGPPAKRGPIRAGVRGTRECRGRRAPGAARGPPSPPKKEKTRVGSILRDRRRGAPSRTTLRRRDLQPGRRGSRHNRGPQGLIERTTSATAATVMMGTFRGHPSCWASNFLTQ